MRRRIVIVCCLVVAASVGLAMAGCSSTIENRDPTGELFPGVAGESLEGRRVAIPADFRGAPVLLLVGYVQKAQFDGDRWLLGLLQGGVDVAVREVPTIEGMLPGLFAGSIDDGMRKGIPEEDWGSVVTVYDDAGKIVAFTGNERPNNMRVLLLDAEGRVAWFHDRGYSANLIPVVEERVAALR